MDDTEYYYGNRDARNHKAAAFIAIEITNNSPEPQDLTMLGIERRPVRNASLKVRSIIGDQIDEEPELPKLFDLISYTPIIVKGLLFNTSMLFDMFKGKEFYFHVTDHFGQQRINPIKLSDYYQGASQENGTKAISSAQSLMLNKSFHLDMTIKLKQTNIQPGERLVLFFDTDGRLTPEALEGMIAKANKIYNKEKTKKIFLV